MPGRGSAYSGFAGPGFSDARFRTLARGQKAPRQKGYRTPQFAYGRLVNTASAGWALAACPLLPGETLVRFDITEWKCGDVGVAPDSATPMMNVAHLDAKNDWMQNASPYASNGEVDAAVREMVEQNTGIGPFEFDPDSGVTQVVPEIGFQGNKELLFADWRLLRCQNISLSWNGVGTTLEARTVDTYVKRVEKNYYAARPCTLVYGVWAPPCTAQTVFAVGNGLQLTPEAWSEVLSQSYDLLGAAAEQQAHELLWGGDTFIEADTLKSPVDNPIRVQGLMQCVIRTPYPLP